MTVSVFKAFTAAAQSSGDLEGDTAYRSGSSVGRDYFSVTVSGTYTGQLQIEVDVYDETSDTTLTVITDTLADAATGQTMFNRQGVHTYRVKSTGTWTGTANVIVHSGSSS